jgi:hypothetical protein
MFPHCGDSGGCMAMFRLVMVLLVLAIAPNSAFGQSPPSYVLSSPLLPLLLQTPENGWLEVNANRYSDVWTPPDLEPLDYGEGGVTHTPSKIILAWSGFAWDSNRGDLILYGGGHANYSGNDVYRWRSSTLRWERAALPSDIFFDPATTYSHAIDGVDYAPSSAHTYDNNVFLPLADRFLTFGGASYDDGRPYLRPSETDPTQMRLTGPYLFDPSRANGNKVGGSTGSHVQRVAPHPEIVGGYMWENRDIAKHLAGEPMPTQYVSGCAQPTVENGHDVVYVAGGISLELYRYQLTDLADPSQDAISKVGAYWQGTSGITTCALDPTRKLFVRTGNNTQPFQFWDLTSPGASNREQFVDIDATMASFQAWLRAQSFDLQSCAMKFDPVRRVFPIWCGGPVTWELHAPAAGNGASGWTIAQRAMPATPAPPTSIQTISILGKWRYAPYYDVFVALEDIDDGNVWIYKPAGWVQPNPPGNALPTVRVQSPAAGASFAPRAQVNLGASASDTDGSVARVEYYIDGIKIGQSSVAPYTVSFNPILVGAYTVTAVAVDNVGGMTKSAGITFTVNATLSTSVLQRDLNGYTGVSDTFLDGFLLTTVHGGSDPLYLDGSLYTPLVRFAIFQSEGGPVPDGAIFQSATLSLYKQYYDETLQLNALLGSWVESEATWQQRASGVPWSAGGAAGADRDYVSAPDVQVIPSFNPGWVDFDVSTRAQQWSDHGGNFGWRLSQTTAGGNAKTFHSSEYTADPSLRPKLTVVYSSGAPASAQYDAQFVSQSVPASMVTGQTYAVSITVKNTGNTTWTNTTGAGTPGAFSLGSQNPRDNVTWRLSPVANRSGVAGSVAPGATATFRFNVVAPANAGIYDFQWQMVDDQVTWFGELTPDIKVTVASPSGFFPNAQFVSQTVPVSMLPGQTYPVSITLKNTGNTTWTNTTGPGTANAYSLGSQNPRDNFTWGLTPFPNRAAVTGSVAPGATGTFSFDVTAPANAGIYDFQWQMVDDQVTWFGEQTPNMKISVASADGFLPDAQFVSQNVPTTMTAGQSYPVSITVKNTGNTTWINAAGPGTSNTYSLGSQNPRDNVNWGTSPYPNRIPVAGSVPPDAITTFTFSVVAPSTAGVYNFQWQMVDENVAWFGSPTPNVQVVVR